MNSEPPIQIVLPPRLTMDEYVDFIESSIQNSDPVFTERQKSIEKRIVMPFRISEIVEQE
jgi:hypothetical protein